MPSFPSLLLHFSTGPCKGVFVHRNNILRENTVQEMNFVVGFEESQARSHTSPLGQGDTQPVARLSDLFLSA